MRFFRVLGAELMSDRRWLRLTMEERGAWVSLAVAASMTQGSITDRDTAELLLSREGAGDSAGMLDRLAAAGLIECPVDDPVAFPVGVDWTLRPPSAEPERVRVRVARHRKRDGNDPASLRLVTETTRGEERRREEEETTAPATAPTIPSNPFITYRDLTGSRLSGRAERWLNDYIGSYGAERVASAMRTAWATDPTPDGLLDRLRPLLNGASSKPRGPVIDLDSPENRQLRGEE